ncbi:MAG: hypothetical protein MK135_11535 [Polyangiaceae bacterium]|nr:hypothetical protein [Polyangiaceae bacterium]
MKSSDIDPPRLFETGNDLERLILQSAELDEPGRRLEEQILSKVQQSDKVIRPHYWRNRIVAGGAAAAAAIGLIYIGQMTADPLTVTMQAENGVENPDLLNPTTQAAANSRPGGGAVADSPQGERLSPSKNQAGGPGNATGKNAAAPQLAPGEDPCVNAPRGQGNQPRIDAIEDRKLKPQEVEGRFGTWFIENDGSGIQQPRTIASWTWAEKPHTPAEIRTSGSRFNDWGASIGVTLAGGSYYDASVYQGIEFEAVGPARVNVSIQTVDVVPIKEGGTCTQGCYANHRKSIEIGAQRARYRVNFDELVQHEFGSETTFDPARLRSIIFQVAPEDTPFEFAISELKFIQ